MDGVDVAWCSFTETNNRWQSHILKAITYEYDAGWISRLNGLHKASAEEYARVHSMYGAYLGDLVKRFREEFHAGEVDFISSHGHTVFHQPSAHFTAQIGEGAALAARSGCTVVCDFRTGDVAHGGQGAPLVPIGDQILFGEYTFCLNLGGIANISYSKSGQRIAYDVCPCNILMNPVALRTGIPFDRDGKLAATGTIREDLLQELNNLSFYDRPLPKSLGREDMESMFIPAVNRYDYSPADLLCTLAEHAAMQIERATAEAGLENAGMLCSGGGTLNTFLIDRVRRRNGAEVIVPDASVIHYKEALVFAFLGVLRMRGEANCLSTVTGASKNVSGGCIYLP
jgi:anhydro-N-acetylmuramic acid kinase